MTREKSLNYSYLENLIKIDKIVIENILSIPILHNLLEFLHLLYR